MLYRSDETYELAIVEVQKAVDLSANDPEANYVLGDIYVKAGKPADAVPFLKKALGKDPNYLVLPGNLWVSELARGTDVRGSGGTCDRWIQRIVDLLPSRSGRAGGHLGSAHQR